jgi:hypothetical protein
LAAARSRAATGRPPPCCTPPAPPALAPDSIVTGACGRRGYARWPGRSRIPPAPGSAR